MGAGIHHDAVDRCDPLQSGRRVHHVADDSFPVGGIRQLQDRLPRGDGGANRQGERWVCRIELRQGLLDAKRCPHCPLRVVLVDDRRPEHREHTVAHQLLDTSPEPLHVGSDRGVISREPFPYRLRVALLGVGCEPDQIAEQDRDALQLLVGCRRSRGSCRGWLAAGGAEPSAFGQRLAARTAGRHDRRSAVRTEAGPFARGRSTLRAGHPSSVRPEDVRPGSDIGRRVPVTEVPHASLFRGRAGENISCLTVRQFRPRSVIEHHS
jgi:hypothetical protein